MDGVSFEEAWRDRVPAMIDDDLLVNLISLEHLHQKACARRRDLDDVKEIEEVNEGSKRPSWKGEKASIRKRGR
jgi:hypothetical protein